ncbi:MAG: GAF domain-containing protein [Deltaproteobacteria bacterium]|nr:GAF domain-containing protein [Deltaproteobacteria bacterium]
MARSDPRDSCDQDAALIDLFARGSELARHLIERLRSAEASNARWAERHAETERCHDDLANLFVASDQLHATRDPDEVVAAICEIVINLVGAEIFVLHTFDPESERLIPLIGEGCSLGGLPELALGEGTIGQAVARGRVWIAPSGSAEGTPAAAADPIVVVPLCVRGVPLGAIAIYKLLDQKPGLSELDHQLFDLLAQHASKALLVARLEEAKESVPARRLQPIDRITN